MMLHQPQIQPAVNRSKTVQDDFTRVHLRCHFPEFRSALPDAPRPLSAPVSRKTAHDAPCAGLRAGIRASLTYWNSRRIGFLDRWLEAEAQSRRQAEVIKVQIAEASHTIQRLVSAATDNLLQSNPRCKPTCRKLARVIGLPESTFRKIRKSVVVNPHSAIANLPRLRAALEKINPF